MFSDEYLDKEENGKIMVSSVVVWNGYETASVGWFEPSTDIPRDLLEHG